MTESHQDIRGHIASLSDEALLKVVVESSDEYTSDALALTNEEISRRGGIEFLKQRVQQSREEKPDTRLQGTYPPEIPDPSNEIAARLKKFYWVPVLVAYGLFLYLIRGSLWLYWLCVFGMIAFWIRVLINARKLTPEEEYAEIAKEMEERPPKDNPSSEDEEQVK